MNEAVFKDLEQFVNVSHSKKIVCFGAGKALENMFKLYGMKDIIRHIEYVVDNNKLLWDTYINIGDNKTISVKSPDYLKSDQNEDVILIITNRMHQEAIISQLDGFYKFSYCTITDIKKLVLRDASKKLPSNFRVYSKMVIPKIIHYCWFGQSKIPLKYKEWMKSWKKYCPDYQIIEWNESNYDYKKNQYMYEAYRAKKWAFVSDYARLDIINEYGGIYLDTDVELVKNLDDFLYEDGFGGFDMRGFFSTGLGFGAKKENEFIKECIKQYDKVDFINFDSWDDFYKKDIMTCNKIQTKLLEKKGFVFDNRIQEVEGFRIYPAPVLDGYVTDDMMFDEEKNIYSIHHYEASWLN